MRYSTKLYLNENNSIKSYEEYFITDYPLCHHYGIVG
jgi:hypothetical protein